ncbi:MAG: TetR/AcrR family transcriptional regulator [Puniceicoccales bacterium]|jgi:AcrR family transcriptional regulator|nr:TetR/AcrR family transcriptional regulator [Puniceicoccales bacterium]
MLNNREKKVTDRRNIQGENTRIRILKGAARLFAQRGYDNVSIRDIAEKSYATPSLVMHHFGNKAALYRKMVTQYFENGNIFFRSAIPILKVDASDKQAAANAIAEAIHISFETWHGLNRIKFVDNLLIQVMLGRGSVEDALAVEWILPMKRVFEDFFMRIKPQMSPDELRARMEIFFSNIFYPAISRKLILSERTWSDFSPEFLLVWQKSLSADFCLGLGLPLPTYIYPVEKVVPATGASPKAKIPTISHDTLAGNEELDDGDTLDNVVLKNDELDDELDNGGCEDASSLPEGDFLSPKEDPLGDTRISNSHKRNQDFGPPPLDSE